VREEGKGRFSSRRGVGSWERRGFDDGRKVKRGSKKRNIDVTADDRDFSEIISEGKKAQKRGGTNSTLAQDKNQTPRPSRGGHIGL